MSSSSERGSSNGFAHFPLAEVLHRGIAAAGFTEPRPIQEEAIPAALDGRDILGLARTGTGKTAAFALPALERILAGRGTGTRVLVLAPTRELASQIAEEFSSLARFTRIRVAKVFGGVSERSQITELRHGPEVVVACPGRLLDLLGRKLVRLDAVETLVLDEADHMFDMGFLPDVRRILASLPASRQNWLFSATMPTEIRRLADRILDRPHVVDLTRTGPGLTIEHALYPVPETSKSDLLNRLLSVDGLVSAIVFTRTKHRAKRLARQLEAAGVRAVALQGNMSQNARTRAMGGFREKRFDVLVATDIAARGIDVEQVSHVINFDMPNTTDAYTHRIGRTGRSEREGKAYTFVTRDDREMVAAVERRLGAPIPRRRVEGVPIDDGGAVARPPARPAARPGNRSANGPRRGSNPPARRPRRSGIRRAS
jgi:ATP-dependent RNA helicase RhlE